MALVSFHGIGRSLLSKLIMPEKGVTHVSEHVLPMSPVYTGGKGSTPRVRAADQPHRPASPVAQVRPQGIDVNPREVPHESLHVQAEIVTTPVDLS
jgi:hypothetical protein